MGEKTLGDGGVPAGWSWVGFDSLDRKSIFGRFVLVSESAIILEVLERNVWHLPVCVGAVLSMVGG